MVTRALKNGRPYRFVVNSVYGVLVAGGEGVKDVENDCGSILDTGMRKGRIEVSGRTPIVRELFRFDLLHFTSAACSCGHPDGDRLSRPR